jgi:hypothetical protein
LLGRVLTRAIAECDIGFPSAPSSLSRSGRGNASPSLIGKALRIVIVLNEESECDIGLPSATSSLDLAEVMHRPVSSARPCVS